ncbi:hypothetical protein GOP47_0011980 [Adiantum capillus-veneris]|uniref:Uncharacterized protein n=1 Tax=Adiantum capillus-veneris TaxID=13818 RepID=A0A9D4UU84_ADICA|nr:hypothetical protein GOP47_0011980 [Adiantum capillus-veneris]
MDISSDVNIPARSSARPIQPLSSSLMDKFLGMSLSPASVQSLSSDTSDANDLDELDEQEIWGMEISGKPYADGSKEQQQTPLPRRMISSSRRLSATPESRSPLKDGSTSWTASTANSLSSISGTLPGFSPLGSGGRSLSARILSSEATARRVPAASRMIPRMSQQYGEALSSSVRAPAMPQSAPLNIPHWSKLERRHDTRPRVHLDDDDAEDGDEERLPPHELLAREYARSEKTSFSVLEGAGHTLKGRDLSRVRNAVLTYTGFVE